MTSVLELDFHGESRTLFTFIQKRNSIQLQAVICF